MFVYLSVCQSEYFAFENIKNISTKFGFSESTLWRAGRHPSHYLLENNLLLP
jgi:hypothetical protein